MPSIPETRTHAWGGAYPLPIVMRGEQLYRRFGVFHGIDGFDFFFPATPLALIQIADFHLLDMGRIREHDGA